MAIFAAYLSMRARQREAGAGVVKGCAFPTLWGVAAGTVGAKLSLVFIIFLMTGIAILGGAFEDIVDMALFTIHFCMFAFQFEG